MSPDPIRGEHLRAEVADMRAALGAAPTPGAIVLWGRHPAHGAAWLKLAEDTSAAYRQARHAEGWELTTRPAGEHPDD